MPEGATFNVYIVDGGTVVDHTQGGTSYTTVISDAAINVDAEAVLISAKYWNPNVIYNNQNYGFWYDEGVGS